jgi:hypothetical protein
MHERSLASMVSNEVSSQIKSSLVKSAHSRPPLLASGAHSIGFRRLSAVYVFMYSLD